MAHIGALLAAGPVISAAAFFFKNRKAHAAAPVVYALLHAGITAYLFVNGGRFSEYLKIDGINRIFLAVLSLVFCASAAYNYSYMTGLETGNSRLFYYSMAMNAFVSAMTGVVLAANLGVMWVFIEATTLASAYLIYFKAGKAALEAAWKYIFMCSIGIVFAFAGIIFLSAAVSGYEKSLSFDSLAAAAESMDHTWLKLSFVFMAMGFGTKAGLAPVHSWLPDAHSEAPSPVSAMLSAALLNSAMLALYRVFDVMRAAGLEGFASGYMLLMAVLSLFVAAVYIVRVGNYKRMLAYSSIENMGILAAAMAMGKPAIAAFLLHASGHSLAKAAFFLTSGNILKRYGVKEMSGVTGLRAADGRTAWLWVLSFVMLSGIPPSPLFFSEFTILKLMLSTGRWLPAVLMMAFIAVIIYGMATAVLRMFSGTAQIPAEKLAALRYVPQAVLILALAVISAMMLFMWG